MPEGSYPGGLVRRLTWLAVSVAVGAAVGTTGYLASGSQFWFLAVPATLAATWLFVGTPEQCIPAASKGTATSDG